MDLDEQGCAELHAHADEFLADILKIGGDAANRMAEEGTDPIPVSVAIFGFLSARPPGAKSPAHRRRG